MVIDREYRVKLASVIHQNWAVWCKDRDNLDIDEVLRQLTYIHRPANINPETFVRISDIKWLADQISRDVADNEIITDKRWKRFEVGRVYLTRWDCKPVPERVRRRTA